MRPVWAVEPCSSLKIKIEAYAPQYVRINGKVQKLFIYFPIEKIWSRDSGRYDQIAIKSAKRFSSIEFIHKKIENEFTFTQKEKNTNRTNIKDLPNLMESLVALAPGELRLILKLNQKEICEEKIILERGGK